MRWTDRLMDFGLFLVKVTASQCCVVFRHHLDFLFFDSIAHVRAHAFLCDRI